MCDLLTFDISGMSLMLHPTSLQLKPERVLPSFYGVLVMLYIPHSSSTATLYPLIELQYNP